MKWIIEGKIILSIIDLNLQTTHSYFKIDSINSISLSRLRFYFGKPQLFEAQPTQKALWPIWFGSWLVILGPGFNSLQSFG